MVSWRLWSGILCLAAVFAACSGKSKDGKDEVVGSGGSAGENGDGGTAQTTGAAGDPGVGGVGASVTGTGFGTPTATTAGHSTAASSATGSGGLTTGSSSSTTGMTTQVPSEWRCSVLGYENGVCDCGCGAPDPDCDSDDIDDCAACNTFGSCNRGACPGKIDPDDITQCVPPPRAWTCPADAYEDQMICNCGCGVVDPDCASDDPNECEVCNATGSCSDAICPGSIDLEDNTTCDLPEGWTCAAYTYGNGVCDCGCGVIDRDCNSLKRDACDTCSNGCSVEYCPGTIDAEDNTICTGVPYAWYCSDRFYGDGSLCHCGCGVLDPDCASAEGDVCDRCDFEGSCSAQECPGIIDPDNNAYCRRPPAPDDWICGDYAYGDGLNCDCGCGAIDVDCRTDSIDDCDSCNACGSYRCPGRVDPDDTASCAPPPEDWTCLPELYADGYQCDCGCYVLDPDCSSELATACSTCQPNYGSCAEDYNCRGVDPENNARCSDSAPDEWTCDVGVYGDGACDCGCGARDLDCDDGSIDACEYCDLGCSESDCPGSISEEDNALCTE